MPILLAAAGLTGVLVFLTIPGERVELESSLGQATRADPGGPGPSASAPGVLVSRGSVRRPTSPEGTTGNAPESAIAGGGAALDADDPETSEERRPFQGKYWNDAVAATAREAQVSLDENLRLARSDDMAERDRALSNLILAVQGALWSESGESRGVLLAQEERIVKELLLLRSVEHHPYLRKKILRGLSETPRPEVLEALAEVVRTSDDPLERKVAIESLGRCGGGEFGSRCLRSPRFESPETAAASLAEARRAAAAHLAELAKVPRSDRESELIVRYRELLASSLSGTHQGSGSAAESQAGRGGC